MLARNWFYLMRRMNAYKRKDIIFPFLATPHIPIRALHNSKNRFFYETPVVRASVEAVRQPRWTLDSTVREILLVTPMLNDFLRHNVGVRGVVESNDGVTMEAFLLKPSMYIKNKKLRKYITALPAYEGVVNEVKRAKLLRETADNLERAEVYSLQQWEEFKDKESIDRIAKAILNAALNAAKRQEEPKRQESVVIEGAYESVYNAEWHYVEGVDDKDKEGFGMQVKEGKPPTVWTEDEVMRGSVEEDNDNEKPVDGRLELMVLTSENGWPYTVFNREESCDIHVNKEVMRVCHKILKDLNEYFGNTKNADKKLTPYVLIGTPGIGKSLAAGSLLLHQLLHYNANELPVVVYFLQGGAYLFEGDSDGGGVRVSRYKEEKIAVSVVEDLSRDKRGYIIYDVSEKSPMPPDQLPPPGWGMIVISSPDESQFKGWEKQKKARRIIMNCSSLLDIKAMCAWEKRNQLDECQKYWDEIKNRIDTIGPVLRCIFSDKLYGDRCIAVEDALIAINQSNITEYVNILRDNGDWKEKRPSHKLVKIYRVVRNNVDTQRNISITEVLKDQIRDRVLRVLRFPLLTALCTDSGANNASLFEKHGVEAFLINDFVTELGKELIILQPPVEPSHGKQPSQRMGRESVLKRTDVITFPIEGQISFPIRMGGPKRKIEFNRLYKPDKFNFPLVDGFYFVKSPEGKVTLIGVQATIAKSHRTTANTVCRFKKYLMCFSDWAAISKDVSWEIIYLQPYNNDPMKKISEWQECSLNPPGVYTDNQRKSIISFWNKDVNQYQVSFSPTLINALIEAYVKQNKL